MPRCVTYSKAIVASRRTNGFNVDDLEHGLKGWIRRMSLHGRHGANGIVCDGHVGNECVLCKDGGRG